MTRLGPRKSGVALMDGPVAQEVVDRLEALRARGVVHAGHVDDLLELSSRVVLEEAASMYVHTCRSWRTWTVALSAKRFSATHARRDAHTAYVITGMRCSGAQQTVSSPLARYVCWINLGSTRTRYLAKSFCNASAAGPRKHRTHHRTP